MKTNYAHSCDIETNDRPNQYARNRYQKPARKCPYLYESRLDMFIIHKLGEYEKLLPQKLVGKVHLKHNEIIQIASL